MKFKFGKYAGSDVQDVPLDYLQWLLDDSKRRNSEIESEISRRQAVETASMDLTELIVRTGYRELAKKAHPDQGGTTQDFQALNAAYERLKVILKEVAKL